MTGYLRSTRHAAADRRINAKLKAYDELLAKYLSEGMPKDEASKRAMSEVRRAKATGAK